MLIPALIITDFIEEDIFGTHSCRSASTSSMKFVMVKAGINIDIFGAHGCRSAQISLKKSKLTDSYVLQKYQC
jgi:hypothetical protein